MKKKSRATTAKKAVSKKKPAVKSAKPTKKKEEEAKKAPGRSGATEEPGERPTPYTPPPVHGIGWAPFRYPPQ